MIQDWRGRRVTVMGLGLFGGGVGAARWLVDQGAEVTVTDLKTERELEPSVRALQDAPIRWRLGGHDLDDFLQAEVVVASPAVPSSSPFLQAATAAHRIITSEMNLFLERCPAPILGITGSNGKTTTTHLVYEMVRRGDRRTWMGGNVGISLLGQLEAISPDDWVILELSSFQLEELDKVGRGPEIAVVTNLSPNHLDRHETLDAYIAAKKNILRFLHPGGTAILNRDDPIVWAWRAETKARLWGFSLESDTAVSPGTFLANDWFMARVDGRDIPLMAVRDFLLPGRHNRANALAASAAALAAGSTPQAIANALTQFRGVPHRLELVAESAGVRFYNDSKATTPEAGIVALESFPDKVILIAGGYDKRIPFDSFGREIARRAKSVVLLGQSADSIEAAIRAAGSLDGLPEIVRAGDFAQAVEAAAGRAAPGDVVLLSPGCASYGMFNNYVERGDQFRALVLERLRSYASRLTSHG